jgi:hypothetical protein
MLTLQPMKALLEPPLKLRANGLTVYFVSVAIFQMVVTAMLLNLSGGRLPIDRRFVAATLCLNGFLAILLLLAHRDVQTWVTARVAGNGRDAWLFLFSMLLVYLAYALGTDSFGALPFLKLAAYVLLPAALFLTIRLPQQGLLWQDVLVILALWLPLDFRWMRDVWGWPSHSLAYSMNSLLATGLAVFLFVCVRGLADVGYRCHFEKLDGWIGVRNFLLFVDLPHRAGLGFYDFQPPS